MLVQFSSLVSQMIGRSQGSVYQRVKGGTIMRTQKAQSNSTAGNLYKTKINIATLQQAWQALSAQDRQLWEVYAIFRNRPSRKIITGPLGGQATFILENSIRLQFVQAFGALSPEILSTPVITTPPQAITITAITNSGATLTVGTDYNILDATKFIFMYITRPLLLSQMSVWNKTKLIPNMSTTGQAQVITSFYNQKWGTLPAIGQAVNTEIFLYDKNISTFGAGNKQRIIVT
jgi:hypothetical protein